MRSLLILLLLLIFAPSSQAHFGAVIPADDIVEAGESQRLPLTVKFIHPMEQHYMEMARPERFGLLQGGQRHDLLELLRPVKGKSTEQQRQFTYWRGEFTIKRPGDYTFFVEPQPYWEPAEDLFIIHYTKVCINALGLEDSWDQPVGLETEIVPLTRPYGLWTNNLFSGQVLLQGKPVPFAEIEVEYLNESSEGSPQLVPPSGPYVTQVIKADASGIFHYAMPRSGWWGFAALSEASWTLPHDGEEKPVEIGAVYWVFSRDMN